ncbi:MAG: dicarboxylate/amino acid:cation symporter [Bacteroidetes bacterium]|nr:dicarboxylate/amino acid:cation symporter [Bacteroidota bacterium]
MALHWQILIGLVLGVLFGIFLSEGVKYVSWMGDLFLRLLKMIVIPLIVTSIVTGLSNIQSSSGLGRLGLKTVGYYLTTSLFAITTGLVLVNIIKPGVGANLNLSQELNSDLNVPGSLSDVILNIVPSNVFEAMANGQMLPIIFFAILTGFFITRLEDKHRNFLNDAFNAGYELMMKMTMFVIKFTPYGVFGIVAKVVAEQEDFGSLIRTLGVYMLVVVLALAIHGTITLPLILRFIGKVKPMNHFRAVSAPLLTAFSTSSSSATLPLTITSVEENSGVSNKVAGFTLPLGATVNMDGTALYEMVAAMFIAQAYGYDLSIGQQLIAVVTALLASIGAAGIPMAGLVMLTIVLTTVGLPLEGVGMILAVDRILDMFRTSVNVWSDTCGAVTIAKSEGEELNV